MGDYTRNHYVPEWYQYRFFDGCEKEKRFFYLDMKPGVIKSQNGKKYPRKAMLRWGPPRCFYEENLYTTKFLDWESTEIEEKFFGQIDTKGKMAVEFFSEYEHLNVNNEAFNDFLLYMSIQKLRTPKGLSYLASMIKNDKKNNVLLKMQEYQMMRCSLWTECVWNIVSASDSNIKFIISDNPVTVYNQECFPGSSWCRNDKDPVIWLDGTQTIFPLSIDKALILTNLSWARNPYGNPTRKRPNSQLFRPTIFNYTSIQTGRSLSENDVLTINHIIKSRAKRYVAAVKQEWLYPEKSLKKVRWDKIGKSYMLMPDPRSMSFSSETIIGYNNNRADAFDEYGRKPWHDDYKEKERSKNEWNTFHAFQGEYARLYGPKRRGLSCEFGDKDRSVDSDDIHEHHLKSEQHFKEKIRRRKQKK